MDQLHLARATRSVRDEQVRYVSIVDTALTVTLHGKDDLLDSSRKIMCGETDRVAGRGRR
jgi:hypothetical protein